MALIDHWKLDESSGSTAASIGSNENELTVVGSVSWLPTGGRINGAAYFAGTFDVLNGGEGGLSYFPCKSDGSGPDTFSIAAWVYVENLGSPGKRNPILSKAASYWGTPRSGFVFSATDEANGIFPHFQVWRTDSASSSVTANTAIQGNTWQHVAVSYQYIGNGTSKIRLYLNGSLVGSTDTAVGPPQDNPQHAYLGGYRWEDPDNSARRWFNGRIDDVRLFDHAVSATEVANIYSQETNAQSTTYWEFEEGSGSIANDSEGTNDLTLVNSPTWLADPDGIKGGCLSFDGSNDYGYRMDDQLSGIPGQFDGTGPTTFTVSIWFYITETLSSSKRYPLINKYGLKFSKDGNSWDGGWALFASNASSNFRPEFWTYSGSTSTSTYKTVITSNTRIYANTWHHLIAQFEGNGAYNSQTSLMALWLDGVEVASTSTAWGPVTNSPQPLEIGRYKNNREGVEIYTRARLDEARLFNYWLSSSEIADLHEIITPVYLSGHTLTAEQGNFGFIYPGFVDLSGHELTSATAIDAAIYINVTMDSHALALPLAIIGTSTDSDLYEWLQENKGVRSVLMEATYHDGTSTGTVYISNTGYITGADDTPANTSYIDALVDIPEIFESINSTGSAVITVENPAGERDSWLQDYSFNGWPLKIYIGDHNWELWRFREIVSGITENVTSPNSHQLQFQLIDKSAIFDTPVQTSYMTGELADERVLVPLSLGKVVNVPCVLVSETTHRYKVHEGTITSIDQARAAGWSRSFTAYLSEGEFAFGNDWEAEVTADITGETSGQAADMIEWLALRAGLTAGEIDATSFADFPNTATLGYWVDSDKSIGSIIDEILASVGGFKRFTPRGILQILRLDFPQAGGSVLTEDDILEDGLEPIDVQSPRLTTQIGYYRRWLVQSPANLLTGISEATRYKSTTEYKRVYSTNTGIEAQFPLAETTDLIPTLFFESTDAQVEANRRRDIRAARLYTFRVLAYSLPFEFSVGDSINIIFPRYGFESGRNMRILSVRQKPTENIVEMEVWGP